MYARIVMIARPTLEKLFATITRRRAFITPSSRLIPKSVYQADGSLGIRADRCRSANIYPIRLHTTPWNPTNLRVPSSHRASSQTFVLTLSVIHHGRAHLIGARAKSPVSEFNKRRHLRPWISDNDALMSLLGCETVLGSSWLRHTSKRQLQHTPLG